MKAYTQKEKYWLWLHRAFVSDVSRMNRLLAEYDCVEELFALAGKKKFPRPEYLNEKTHGTLLHGAEPGMLDKYVDWLNRRNIEAVTCESENYPALLLQIYDPPAVLFVKGTLEADPQLPLAVIGSRKCSEYGKKVAFSFAKALSESGANIISGLAYGIDVTAARGALANENAARPTVAVLGCGVDVVYPSGNRDVYEQIIERGAVVSEYPPGTEPLKGNFPVRNRILSGMSKGVLVIEAGGNSGCSITVNCALDQGRDVFSVPGRITDHFCAGSNLMIRQGRAKPVFSIEDILEEYGLHAQAKEENALPTTDISKLSFEEALIFKLLCAGERSFDELCELSSLPVAQLNSTLTDLEFSEIIKQLPGRIYSI